MAIRRRGHVDRINSFIVVWAGDEREQVSFDGEVFLVPPTEEQASIFPGSPYKFEGARNRSGDIIPGTVVVADRWAVIEGNRVKVFDADMFVRWTEAIRSDLLDRGLMIVDMPEEVDEAKKIGRPLYEASQDLRARTILENELFRRRKWEEKGTPAPPSSSEHLVSWAIKHLNERGTALSLIQTEDIVGALSKGSGSMPAKTAIETALRPGTFAFSGTQKPRALEGTSSAPSGVTLYNKAQALGVKLVRPELEGLLANEPEVMEAVSKKVAVEEKRLKAMEEAAIAQPAG
jgi:hypothetical protein